MSRIPVDVQFLLESILSEDPDTMNINLAKAEILNSKGASVMPGRYNWDYNKDAITFYIDDKNKVVVFSKLGTHGRMDNTLNDAARSVVVPDLFNSDFIEKSYMGCVGMFSRSTSTSLYFFGGDINNFDGVKKYLKDNRNNLRGLIIRDGIELCGRLWSENNAISFWNEKADIVPDMKLVFDFMKMLKMDPKKCAYEFADSKGLYGYDELSGGVEEKDKLSPEEMHALQAKKHLKKSKQDYGDDYWEKHGKKAAKGFDYPAKADAAVPALEGHIKLKDLLKENPDFVSDEHGGKIAKYYDGDAIAFFAFQRVSLLNQGGIHADIINAIKNVNEDFSNYASNASEVQYLMDEKGIILSSVDGLIDELDKGALGNYLDSYNMDGEGSGSASGGEIGAFRTKSGGIAGRVWTKKKIISFWNRKEDVVKRWSDIEKMFDEMNDIFGNLNDYRVDWLERDVSVKTPLTPASEITSAGYSDDKQQTFIDALFGEKKLSDEEIKKLQAKLHTLPAKEKKEVMLAMGYKNMKAPDIAEKLGMTVAEFNHIMNVNEGEK